MGQNGGVVLATCSACVEKCWSRQTRRLSLVCAGIFLTASISTGTTTTNGHDGAHPIAIFHNFSFIRQPLSPWGIAVYSIVLLVFYVI
jgi:hypothetical protein